MTSTTATRAELPGVAKIPRETLQDRVYRQLTDLILNGEIPPGQLVTIQGIADAFGTSAMPVREALKRLASANVLTVVSGRSIGIPLLTAERLSDLRRVRREIEPIAAEWAIGNVTPAMISGLNAHLQAMDTAIAAGDIKAFLRGNRAFHFAIYTAAGSPALDAIIETLWLQISPYFHMLYDSGNYPVANREHRSMVDALEAGDRKALRGSVCRDIDMAYEVLIGLLA
ncbi:GntR family transcriptional regulator [Microbaculum marinum]|uniref:GntR family transcriptional regulator n=1 Tax=Microbaculum marinum TaxID=1764581 RepID=A0AAW9RIH1_9HYPH